MASLQLYLTPGQHGSIRAVLLGFTALPVDLCEGHVGSHSVPSVAGLGGRAER